MRLRAIKNNFGWVLTVGEKQLSEAQRLRAIDAMNRLLQGFDNVVFGATKVGREAMNFSMLNFNDRRNIDTVLGLFAPFITTGLEEQSTGRSALLAIHRWPMR